MRRLAQVLCKKRRHSGSSRVLLLTSCFLQKQQITRESDFLGHQAMSIKLNDDFVFIRTPRESRSDRALLLENFNLGIVGQNDVLFYRLFLTPSDNPSNEEDKVEVKRDGEARAKVNEIVAAVGGCLDVIYLTL